MSVCTIATQLFPPSSKWSVDEIPDLTGKVALVTGGNTGIGKETCKQLLLHNCDVWLAARSKAKAEEAIEELKKETGKTASFLPLDLSDLKAVKESAEAFKSKANTLHLLFCNAGVMVPPIEQVTVQKYDLQFGVNVLAHFLLIQLLLPLLKSTSKTSGQQSRILWTSSSVQYYFSPPVKYETLKDTPARTKFGTQRLYMESKFITVMMAYHLAKLLEEDKDSQVICIVLDPGNIHSDLQRNARTLVNKITYKLLLYPTPMGAVTQLFAGTSPEAADYNGKYLRPWARVGEPHSGTKDVKEQQKAWDYCMDAIKEYL